MISPTNQNKNSVSMNGANKTGTFLWGDVDYTWGDILATWGNVFLSPVNQSKTISSYLELENGDNFLLEDNSFLQLEGGTGTIFVNASKS